jgi:arylsulfatase A-like enzyme
MVDGQVSNIDLAPTIVDLAGATPGRTMDGVSLLSLLADPGQPLDRDGVLVEAYDAEGEPSSSAVRTPRYLYAEYATGERELCDLDADPDQLESRHDDPALDAVQAELAERLAALRTCSGAQECG